MNVLDQMARAYSVKGGTRRFPVTVFYNVLDLAGINARILFKEHQQQESPEESTAAAGWGAEGRIHGGESGSRHKVGSSGSNHRSRHGDGASAGPKELQTEPNIGHLKCHKPVCGNCARRAVIICGDCDQWLQWLFFVLVLDQCVSCFLSIVILLFFLLYIIIYHYCVKIKSFIYVFNKLLLIVNFLVLSFLY